MNEIKKQIERLFNTHGITVGNREIELIDAIVDEIFDRETTAAFQRGVNAHLDVLKALED